MVSMTHHVLVPLDGSEQAWKALDCARTIFEGKRITVLHVVEPAVDTSKIIQIPLKSSTSGSQAQEWGKSLCEEACNRFQEISVLETTILRTKLESGDPASVILECIESQDIDHIILGKQGQSNVSSSTLGGVAERVVHRSPIPVTVIP